LWSSCKDEQTATIQVPGHDDYSTGVRTGSALFTMCEKLTAMRLKLTHADTCPCIQFAASSTRNERCTLHHRKDEEQQRTTVWNRATGRRAFAKSPVMRGRGIVFVIHRTMPQSTLAISCHVAIAYGIGKALRVCLLICDVTEPA